MYPDVALLIGGEARKTGSAGTVLGSIITAAPEMLKVARTIERVANADVSVMLLGASGTGKELLARAVHDLVQDVACVHTRANTRTQRTRATSTSRQRSNANVVEASTGEAEPGSDSWRAADE